MQSLSGACVGHSVGSPYRVLRSYVFDDNADVLAGQGGSSPRSRAGSIGSASTNSDSSEFFSTRHLFSGRQVALPTLYIPGHGHIIPPAPRPPGQEWNNPRDYWTRRQRVSNSSSTGQLLRNPSLSIISEEGSSSVPPQHQQQAPQGPPPPSSRHNLLVDVHQEQGQDA